MKNPYVLACFRAAVVTAPVVYLRAVLLVNEAPDTWPPISSAEQLTAAICVFALAYVPCLKVKSWIATLLFTASYCFAQLAASAPVGGPMARWFWAGFVVTFVPTAILTPYWSILSSRANRLRLSLGEFEDRSQETN